MEWSPFNQYVIGKTYINVWKGFLSLRLLVIIGHSTLCWCWILWLFEVWRRDQEQCYTKSPTRRYVIFDLIYFLKFQIREPLLILQCCSTDFVLFFLGNSFLICITILRFNGHSVKQFHQEQSSWGK